MIKIRSWEDRRNKYFFNLDAYKTNCLETMKITSEKESSPVL